MTGPEESQENLDEVQRHAESEQWLARRQLERKLHDGAALRISALALRIGLLRHEDNELGQWRNHIGEIQDELHAVLQELREIASDIYPPLLDQAGLGSALRELADQRGCDLRVNAEPDRFGPVAEGAVYFAIAEWLAAHPDAEKPFRVAIARDQGSVVVSMWPVEPQYRTYLDARVRPLGGTVSLDTTGTDGRQPGATMMRIPCE